MTKWILSMASLAVIGLGFAGCARSALNTSRPAAEVGAETEGLHRFEFNQPQMGVPFRIVLYATDGGSARAAAEAAFDRVQELNDVLSDYDRDSELSRLSRTSGEGRPVKVSKDLWIVLSRAQKLAGQSGGAFDVTVGPSVNLWRKARRERKLPDPKRLDQARQSTGYQHMRLDPRRRTVELLAPGMRLDLGGIGKGYAVDEALAVLKSRGIPRALVSGGGDLNVGDPPPGRNGWRIELPAHEAAETQESQFVLLSHRALATSGDLFQHVVIDGMRYSHIVDPRTGIGLTDQSRVIVIAPDCTTADTLATTVSVLGPDAGMELIKRRPGVDVRIMRNVSGEIETTQTSGFRDAGNERSDGGV